MKKLLLIIGTAVLVSGCDVFVHPYTLDWYENPCEWHEKPEPGWYCKKPPPVSSSDGQTDR
ncbi:membrane lipoprotein lipid attachment site-containing protein [Oxalobacter sp. OttesenSCG-928-P03]|nr:membrane lipoprotein lipid attachment site-containing protein [Oxalobacter sp. OttesenSCG-928-P03]